MGFPLKKILGIADVDELAARRGYRYALLDAIDDRFGLGWNRRLMRCHRLAIELTRAA